MDPGAGCPRRAALRVRDPKDLPRLHLVTDDGVLADAAFPAAARSALAAGGREVALHLRGPGTSGRRHYELARALAGPAAAAAALLVVNDRVDVALAAGIEAVQLGGRSLPVEDARRLLGAGVLLGASIHARAEAREAVDAGADFLLVGTIWATPSHPEHPGAGLELIRSVAEEVAPVPVVAIGGVTPERIPEVVRADGHGAASLRGVWHASDPAEAVEAYLRALPPNPNASSVV